MIRNYFKIAWRNMLRNKGFSLINITGLALGLACCLLLVLYLQHELSYDRFHTNADRIVRVIMEYKFEQGEGNKGNFTSTKVFPEFKRQFPEVKDGVRMSATFNNSRLVKYEDKVVQEKRFLFADSTFFNVFGFKLLSGTADDVLKAPKMVVISQSAAKRYFGNDNPVGKTLLIGSKQAPFLVTGVSEDCPTNSQIQYDMIASLSSLGPMQEETYSNANYTTYLLMNKASSFDALQRKINAFMKKENEGADWIVNFELEPFTKIHLHSAFDAFVPNSNINYIYIIAGVALLILIIACFTYINLSTARSAERAREVGIRKVSGAFRGQLFRQFLSESVMITIIALLLSVFLMLAALPSFNSLAGTQLQYDKLLNPAVIGITMLFVAVVALLAGSYPALMLSGFQPVKVLKGSFKNTVSGTALRKGLIVFQFTVSVFLIIATFVIKSQLQFIQNKKLGFAKDNVVVLDIDQAIMEKIDAVKTELNNIPSVKGVSLAYESPVTIRGGYNMSGTDLSKQINVTANPVDENYVPVMGLEIIAGTNITMQDVKSIDGFQDTSNYYYFMLNESAASALGWKPQEAIGKKMYLDETRPGEVKAVVKDFHFASMHTEIQPLVLFPGGWASNLFVKTDGKNTPAVLKAMESKWKTLASHRPFTFHFLDEEYQKLYDSEMRTGKVLNLFAILAVLLACLGLFGLSAYAAKQRIKEIGVRKVLGASATNISLLLSSGFLKPVVIAFFIASPVAWFAMNKWLQQFSYRVDIEWWIFIAAGVLSVLIALATVSFQSVKAAISNPVKSLRAE